MAPIHIATLALLVGTALGATSALAVTTGPTCVDPPYAEACGGPYHDPERLRSGATASTSAFGCEAHAGVEYFDNDGDRLPDTVPPGGPPPDVEHGAGC